MSKVLSAPRFLVVVFFCVCVFFFFGVFFFGGGGCLFVCLFVWGFFGFFFLFLFLGSIVMFIFISFHPLPTRRISGEVTSGLSTKYTPG